MAGDGVAVIDMTKMIFLEADFSSAVELHGHLLIAYLRDGC